MSLPSPSTAVAVRRHAKEPQGRATMNPLQTLLSIATLWLGLGAIAHAGTVTYVYSDPQGTPLAEADANGNITATFDYRPYGVQALGAAPNGPGYTGHVNDPDTGLVYMQARYYDPVVGRFLSVDPVGPSAGDPFSFNRFAYADSNPIMVTDPTGRQICNSAGTSPGCYDPFHDLGHGPSGCCDVAANSGGSNSKASSTSNSATNLAAVTVTASYSSDFASSVGGAAVRTAGLTFLGAELFLMDANGFHDMIYGHQGCYGSLTCGGKVVAFPLVQLAKPIPGSKPKSAPPGTIPIDKYPGLSKDDIHTIKHGVGAGPQDWTGIAPNGDVITGDHEGKPVNNGPKGDYLPGNN